MSENQVMRGAEAVNDEFEVGFNSRFETRWHRYELIGRGVLVVVTLAGLAGLLGSGPFSHRTLTEGALAVDFEPICRYDTPTQITLHIRHDGDAQTAQVKLGSNFVEPMGLQGTQPETVIETADKGDLVVTVAFAPGGGEALVRLHAKPTQVGPIALSVQVGDGAPAHWTQFVLP